MTSTLENDFNDMEAALDGVQTEENPQQSELPTVPEKYMGKTAEEIILMHQNLESTLGRQSNELGDLRRQNEALSQSVTAISQKQEKEVQVEEEDWYVNPRAIVEKLVNERVSGIEQTLNQGRATAAAEVIRGRHPDIEAVLQDTKFHDYVNGSPIRAKLLSDARASSDPETVSYLVDEYKASQPKANTNVRNGVGETGSSAAQTASSFTITRSQIVDLKSKDQKKYNLLAPKIRQAYIDGRVDVNN
jgi:hypothetical protein